jgi:hypothetical protein
MSTALHKITVCDTPSENGPAKPITSVQWTVAVGDEIWDDQDIATLKLRDNTTCMCLADVPHPYVRAKVEELFCLIRPNSVYAYCLVTVLDA